MQKNGFTRKILQSAIALVCASAGGTSIAAELNQYVSVYGFINGQIESVEAKGGATPYERRGRISDGNSRIGFTGKVAVNDDIKGIWQIEGGLNNFEQGGTSDNGQTATLESRNTFVGMESARFGRLIIGNSDSVYRSLVGSGSALGGNLGMTVHGIDGFNNSSAQLSGNQDSIFSRGESRMKNSVHYLSPELYGFQAGVSYGFDEARVSRSDRSRFSLAARYKWEALSVGIGYDRQSNTGIDTTQLQRGFGVILNAQDGNATTYTKLVASYALPTGTTLGAGYETARFGISQFNNPTASSIYTGNTDNTLKQNAFVLTVAQDFGQTSVLAGYGKLSGLKGVRGFAESDFEAKQVSLMLRYKLNDMLTPYVYFTKITNNAQASINLGQSPLKSNNLGTSSAFLAPGDSPRAIGVGMLARF